MNKEQKKFKKVIKRRKKVKGKKQHEENELTHKARVLLKKIKDNKGK